MPPSKRIRQRQTRTALGLSVLVVLGGCERETPPPPLPSASAPVVEAPPTLPDKDRKLSPEGAKFMTPEQRAARLRADCYPSGICDDDTLEAVTTAAASPAEAAMLKAIDLGHRKAAVARIRNATKALKGLIAASEGGRHDTTQPGNFEGCMKRFMMAKAAREKLDNFGSYALTLPARTAQG